MADRAERYVAVAERLLDAIGGDAAIAGGLAVNAHGYPRATADVDIVTSVPLPEARRRLKEKGIHARLRKGDVPEGDIPCVSGEVGDVPFDVLPNLVPITSTDVEIARHRVRIVDTDTLVRLKLKAGSVKDLYDLAILGHLDRALAERADALAAADAGLARRLHELASDPRTRRQAADLRRTRLAKRASPKARRAAGRTRR